MQNWSLIPILHNFLPASLHIFSHSSKAFFTESFMLGLSVLWAEEHLTFWVNYTLECVKSCLSSGIVMAIPVDNG